MSQIAALASHEVKGARWLRWLVRISGGVLGTEIPSARALMRNDPPPCRPGFRIALALDRRQPESGAARVVPSQRAQQRSASRQVVWHLGRLFPLVPAPRVEPHAVQLWSNRRCEPECETGSHPLSGRCASQNSCCCWSSTLTSHQRRASVACSYRYSRHMSRGHASRRRRSLRTLIRRRTGRGRSDMRLICPNRIRMSKRVSVSMQRSSIVRRQPPSKSSPPSSIRGVLASRRPRRWHVLCVSPVRRMPRVHNCETRYW